MKADSWIILRRENGQFRQEGPLTSEEVLLRIGEGSLKTTDHIWKSGFKTWIPVYQVEELKQVPVSAPLEPADLGEAPEPPEASEIPGNRMSVRKLVTAVGMAAAAAVMGLLIWSLSKDTVVEVGLPLKTTRDENEAKPVPAKIKKSLPPAPVAQPTEKVSEAPHSFRIDFTDRKEASRIKLKLTGPFREGEVVKIRLQARPGDILGRVAHQVDKKWEVSRDGLFEGSLDSLNLSNGRYNYAVMVGAKLWKGTVEVGDFDIGELRDQQKKNAYFIQSERKKLWKALEQIAQVKGKSPSVSARTFQQLSALPELKTLKKGQHTLAFPEAWQELEKLLTTLGEKRNSASTQRPQFENSIRKKVRSENFQEINLEDF